MRCANWWIYRQTASKGGCKVIVLHPAEAMNLNAANALLKVEDTVICCCFWSVTQAPAACCRPIRKPLPVQTLPGPPTDEALQWLTHRHT